MAASDEAISVRSLPVKFNYVELLERPHAPLHQGLPEAVTVFREEC